MTAGPTSLSSVIAPLRAAQVNFEASTVAHAMVDAFAQNAVVNLSHPFGTMTGHLAFFENAYTPLAVAFPDLERRDWIVMSGSDDHGFDWVGCGGHYMGTFVRPMLDIPPTGHLAHMRFHEFYRIEDGKVVEVQAIWDLPELMMQANAWPMAPGLGREMTIPAPATQDGLGPHDTTISNTSLEHVKAMLVAMGRHPKEPVEAMELERYWDKRFNWYGPAGIGTARGVSGFRNWHQIPFLNAMPDRGNYRDQMTYHFFGEGNYVGVTGWPNMKQTLSKDGWLGIAPAGKEVTLCSLDFWRLEGSGDTTRIRENWVLVDLLDLYRQIGVDVFERLREFNKARPGMKEYQT